MVNRWQNEKCSWFWRKNRKIRVFVTCFAEVMLTKFVNKFKANFDAILLEKCNFFTDFCTSWYYQKLNLIHLKNFSRKIAEICEFWGNFCPNLKFELSRLSYELSPFQNKTAKVTGNQEKWRIMKKLREINDILTILRKLTCRIHGLWQ